MIQLLRDIPGWVLMAATFAVPAFRLRHQQSLLLIVWFTLGLHQCAALIDCYVAPIPGGDADALVFQGVAAGTMSANLVREPYVDLLRMLYQALGVSQLLGCELSILAYSVSVLVFLQLVRWTGQERHAIPLVLLYGCLPAAVMHRSVTLRESFQMLAMLLVVWLLVRMSLQPRQVLNYLALVPALAFLGLLHNGLVLLAGGLSILACIWAVRLNPMLSMVLSLPLAIVLVLYYRPMLNYLETASPSTRAVSEGRLTNLVEGYRQGVKVTRTNYGGRLEAGSVDQFAVSFAPVLLNYMFAPLPWQVSGLKDLYALVESVFRMVLFAGLLVNLLRAEKDRRARLLFLTLVFLSVDSMWATASSNWGQAIRHRLVAYAFFLLVGAEPILDALHPGAQVPQPAVG